MSGEDDFYDDDDDGHVVGGDEPPQFGLTEATLNVDVGSSLTVRVFVSKCFSITAIYSEEFSVVCHQILSASEANDTRLVFFFRRAMTGRTSTTMTLWLKYVEAPASGSCARSSPGTALKKPPLLSSRARCEQPLHFFNSALFGVLCAQKESSPSTCRCSNTFTYSGKMASSGSVSPRCALLV